MNMKEILEMAKKANSVEELLAIAKENGMEANVEEATALFDKIHKGGELADDELDNVAGGCSDPACPHCGASLAYMEPVGEPRRGSSCGIGVWVRDQRCGKCKMISEWGVY